MHHAMRQAAVFLLLASLLPSQPVYALDLKHFQQIEDNNLEQIFWGLSKVAFFSGYYNYSPFLVQVKSARGEFKTQWEECNSLWQDVIVVVASSFDESPEVSACTLPPACDWQFSRWLDFPHPAEGERPITLEFIKKGPRQADELVWVKINPYRAELLKESKKGEETYPPNIGYKRLNRLWQDKIADVVEELSSLRQESPTPHLYKADVNRVRLVNNGADQRADSAQDVISISVAEKSNGYGAASFYLGCSDGDWTFGEWTLTGKESIEAGYLGFTLIDRESKEVRHILCNPWTAYVK